MSFSRRIGNETLHSTQWSDIFEGWQGSAESWIFVGPHDDDIVLGAGLLIQKAQAAGVKQHMLITTDGQMGYCALEERDSIAKIREEETRASFQLVGIDAVEWLGFPDGSLQLHGGRRRAPLDATLTPSPVVAGYVGLQNAYTECFRRIKPTRIFLPTGEDLHPDHKMVYQEVLVSIFHASTDIWPELGAATGQLPKVYEMAIYCDFPVPPDLRVLGSDAEFEKKLAAIGAYRSQKQISQIVDQVRAGGAVEYYRDIVFNLYSPAKYRDRF